MNANPELYTISLDSTNHDPALPEVAGTSAITGTYTPSRAVRWYYNGPAYAPADGHIGYDYNAAYGWNDFYNDDVGGIPGSGIKGIQSLTLDYQIIGSIYSAKVYFAGTRAPISDDFVDLKTETSPLELDATDFAAYQSNFYLRFRLYSSTLGVKFIIKSLTITYTCSAS
ncbi:MAG: hypothetical protein WC399_04945 [Bacilli bacterium]